jgi:integrase/recombinase XerD
LINSPDNLIFDTRIDTHKIYVSMKTTFIPRNYDKEFLPLYLHITGLGKRERLLLDIEIQKKLWNKKKQRVNFNTIEDIVQKKRLEDINLIIDNIESKITNIKTVYRLSEIVLTPKKLKQELLEDLPRVNFCSFCQHALIEQKQILEPGTYRKLQSVLNKLKKYNDQVIFSDLNLNWFESYRIHLSKIGNQKTTINSNIKSLKKFLRIALKTGIKIPCNMDDIKAGSTLGTRISLEPYELKKIKEYFDSDFIYKSHKTIVAYFLFSCVTGLRFADVMQIEREAVQGDFIQFRAEKVNKMQTITLNLKAKELIAQDETLFVKRFTNEYVNRELKVIMRNLSIKKKVTFHVSRHTFATSFLRAGGKIEKLQLLLGHSDLRQSMIYNHIVAAEANKEIFLLDTLY